jgi:hypothetical protein
VDKPSDSESKRDQAQAVTLLVAKLAVASRPLQATASRNELRIPFNLIPIISRL